MRLAAWAGATNWKRPETVPGSKSLAGKAYQTKEPVVANDYPAHSSAEPSALEPLTKRSGGGEDENRFLSRRLSP